MNDIYLILDNVRSMHNVGAIFRTCDGAGVKELFLCGITATPPRSQIEKTALGATNTVSWKYYKSTIRLVNLLKKRSIRIIALEQSPQSISFKNFYYDRPLAIVVGNEINGVDPRILRLSDAIVDIPMHGSAKSLNVATSVGIILYHFR